MPQSASPARRRASRSPRAAPSEAPAQPRPSAWLRLHIAVSIAAIAAFARAVPYPLQASWDDGRFIVDNTAVHSVSWAALRSFFSAPHFEAYHPLHLLAYWLDVPWAGAHGPVLHATNLLLWTLGLNLLLRVFGALGLGPASAALATLAFGLHPIQVEVVSWASGRKDVLALLFSAAAMLCHLRATHWLAPSAWLSRLFFACAALSKTTALPLPLVLLLADVLLRGRSAREAIRHQWLSLVLAAGLGLGVIAIWSEHSMIRAGDSGVASGPARVGTTLTHHLSTALWPSATSPLYATDALASPGALPFVALAGFALACVWARRTGARRTLFVLGAFALWLLPVSNLVPMYFPLQDRYLSLPLIGLAFGLGAALDTLRARNPRLTWALGGAVLLALALRCVQYQGEWASETRLFGHAASTHPKAYYAHMKLGEVRRRAGDLHGSVRAYKELLRIDPARKVGYAALLQAAALRDEHLRGLSPSRAEAYAAEFYEKAENPDALLALTAQMLQSGHLRALEVPLRRALDLRPVPDAALESAAALHFREGRPTLGAFYLRRMQRPTQRPELRQQLERVSPALAESPL
jgi:protein O-mannosyl-transferase